VHVAASAVSGTGGGTTKSAGLRSISSHSSLKSMSISLESGRSTTRGDDRIARTVGRFGRSESVWLFRSFSDGLGRPTNV